MYFLSLLVNLSDFKDLEESLVDFVVADFHYIDKLHILLTPVIKFVVITRGAHVARFTNHKLAETVDEGTLPPLQ